MTAATFAALFAALYAAHHLADFWIQTDWESSTKAVHSWLGRAVCALHCTVYGLTGAALVGLLAFVLEGVDVSLIGVAAGTLLSIVLHYLADRRWIVRWLAERLGSRNFAWSAGGPMLLDQAWHYVSLVPIVLVMMAL